MRRPVFLLPALLCLTIMARADPHSPPGTQRVPLGDGWILTVSAPRRLPRHAPAAQELTRPGAASRPLSAVPSVVLSITRNRFVSGNVRAPKTPDACAVLLHITVNRRVLPPVALSFEADGDSPKPVLAPDGRAARWVEHGDVYASTFAVVPAPDARKSRAPAAP